MFHLETPYEASIYKFYDKELMNYKEEGIRRFEIYLDSADTLAFATCVAFAYCEAVPYALNIFKERRLERIHAYAILDKDEWFQFEMDKILEDRAEAQYD